MNVNWIHLALKIIQFLTIVKMGLNIWVTQMQGVSWPDE